MLPHTPWIFAYVVAKAMQALFDPAAYLPRVPPAREIPEKEA